MKSILDPSFRYVSSHATDLRKTFARIKREMRKDDSPEEPRDPNGKIVTLRSDRKRVA
jgi:hypothetical protein